MSCAGFSGLVYSSTSQKPDHAAIPDLVDPMLYRLKKLKRTVVTGARLIQNQNKAGFRYKPCMVTLTYADGSDWSPKDISQFLDNVRKYFRRKFKHYAFQYAWTAELQKRGAIHYHIVLWLPFQRHKALHIPKPDEQGWWYKGSSNIGIAKNAVAYIAKYASKGHMDDRGNSFPKGTRLYAVGGLNDTSKRESRWWKMPLYIRQSFERLGHTPTGTDLRRIVGGFFNRDTGEFLESEFLFCGMQNGSPIMIKKDRLCA